MRPDNERLARFARAHLRTPAQRAVYAALAGAPDAVTSARDIGEQFGVDAYAVDVALRQFQAAGIAEPGGRSPGGERLFRWAGSGMAYLRTGEPPATHSIDPVCGMPVPDDTLYEESGHHFCSRRCQTTWRVLARWKR
ncbi:MAG TPA: hypothetical protein VGR26_15490 [Acidimicrobiales bacterium]|nr:hypothetical protein [Acidimicrobiales bacterium]